MANKKIREEMYEGEEFEKLRTLYLQRLINVALSRFEYENLPDKRMTSTTIEEGFIRKGCNAFSQMDFEDEKIPVVLPFRALGRLDINGYPINIEMESQYNGAHIERELGEYVAGWDNVAKFSILPQLEEYASALARIEITSRVNIDAQMTPYIIKSTSKTLLSAFNKIAEIRRGRRVIVEDSKANPIPIEVLRTDAPFLADKLRALGRQTWNEALGFLGIGSVDNDSRERLIVDEVRTANSSVHAALHSYYQARLEWVDKINKRYGYNITVKCRDIYCDGYDVKGDEAE